MAGRSQERRGEIPGYNSNGQVTPRHTGAAIAARTDNTSAVISYDVSSLFSTGNPTGTFSAGTLPPGLSIHATTGVISGTVTDTAVGDITYRCRVSRKNAAGVGHSNWFNWTVNDLTTSGTGVLAAQRAVVAGVGTVTPA